MGRICKFFILLLIEVGLAESALSQTDFTYSITNEVKDEHIHYEVFCSISVYTIFEDGPYVTYQKQYLLKGLLVPSFSYTNENLKATISNDKYRRLSKRLNKIRLQKVSPENKSAVKGYVKKQNRYDDIGCFSDESNKRLYAVLTQFISEIRNESNWQETIHTVEGDTVSPQFVPLHEIL